MLKKSCYLLLFLFIAIGATAQTSGTLKLRDTELKEYQVKNLWFSYESDIPETDALKIAGKLRPRGENSRGDIYKAPGSDKNLFLFADYEDKTGVVLYRKTANGLTKVYQSRVFRDGYNLNLKIFENGNRALIFAVKREGVGDYIDTEVFEFFDGRIKYLGVIPVGTKEESTGNVDSFIEKAEVTHQSGNYRIKIGGKAYIPAGKRSPNRDKLIGTDVVYVYNGKVLQRGK